MARCATGCPVSGQKWVVVGCWWPSSNDTKNDLKLSRDWLHCTELWNFGLERGKSREDLSGRGRVAVKCEGLY